ncbi:MAG: NAD(P)-dependent oxidoreductase [Actinomycetota bacterium]|nr:NAD(P)-dependent oxidoreductase [Actinomycetota bacterium]
MSRVAFIGCGRMGGPMAGFVLDGGHDLVVYDVDPSMLTDLVSRGATAAESAPAAAADADFVITSLPDPPVVEATYLGDEGLVSRVKPGAVLIDTSTSSAGLAREIADAARERGADSLDAPVSGGPIGAMAGTLAIMIGGSEETYEKALPVLELFGKTIRHMGEAGSGQVTKLTNNLLAGCYMASISEAVALALREGMDPKKLFDVWSNGTANSRVLHTRFPVPGVIESTPASNGWKPQFPVDLAAKDLDLALKMAEESGVEMPMTTTAHSRYRLAQEKGEGHLDYSVVSQLLVDQEGATS